MGIIQLSGDPQRLKDLFDAAMVLGPVTEAQVADFDTLTLIFTEPSVTVTFAVPVDVEDLRSQLQAQLSAVDPLVKVKIRAYGDAPGRVPTRLSLVVHSGSGPGFTLTEAGTANTRLSVSTTAGHSSLRSRRYDPEGAVAWGTRHANDVYILLRDGGLGRFDTNHASRAVQAQLATGESELVEGIVYNDTGGDLYFQLHDVTVALAGGEVPKMSIPIADAAAWSLNQARSRVFTTGIRFGFSTTADTFTAGSAGVVYATYRVM